MFRKILIAAMFATAAGYCFAADSGLHQVVTSEVFYTQDRNVDENRYENMENDEYEYVHESNDYVEPVVYEVPAWPLAGSDADVEVSCEQGVCSKKKQSDNIKIVAKVGDDLVVENNFNLGARDGWTGGANMLHGSQVPAGFMDECDNGSEMPLLHREILEDDGGNVLSVSRGGRKNCMKKYADAYDSYVAKNNVKSDGFVLKNSVSGLIENQNEILVDTSADAEPEKKVQDQVRSWVVASGQTLRQVLQAWCDKEGWDLVWSTAREYPIQASAVFKGRFADVASALVRNFGRANPVPYAKFYKGNRVLVVSTNEE